MTNHAADFRLLEQRARARSDVTDIGADVDHQREQDEQADERRVDDRDSAERDHAGRAAEALLPEKKERLAR